MKVTAEGQVTIPSDIQTKYGIGPMTEVEFVDTGAEVVLRKAEPPKESFAEFLERVRGSANSGLTTDEIMDMTRGEE
jgi:antitoxin PrlF